jgi:hypothetical protein
MWADIQSLKIGNFPLTIEDKNPTMSTAHHCGKLLYCAISGLVVATPD